MIAVYGSIPGRNGRETLMISVEFCSDPDDHGNHFEHVDGRIIWCRGVYTKAFPLCQVNYPEVRDVLPCKHKESGGYQCENLEPHTDEHKFGSHTIRHSLAGNGWYCEDVENSP